MKMKTFKFGDAWSKLKLLHGKAHSFQNFLFVFKSLPNESKQLLYLCPHMLMKPIFSTTSITIS